MYFARHVLSIVLNELVTVQAAKIVYRYSTIIAQS
jgi:hypothetical protein